MPPANITSKISGSILCTPFEALYFIDSFDIKLDRLLRFLEEDTEYLLCPIL